MLKNQDLDKEYKYFQLIKASLIDEYNEGSFSLIKGEKLIGVFATEKEAYTEAVKRFGTELFLIQKIEKEEVPESIQFLSGLNLVT